MPDKEEVLPENRLVLVAPPEPGPAPFTSVSGFDYYLEQSAHIDGQKGVSFSTLDYETGKTQKGIRIPEATAEGMKRQNEFYAFAQAAIDVITQDRVEGGPRSQEQMASMSEAAEARYAEDPAALEEWETAVANMQEAWDNLVGIAGDILDALDMLWGDDASNSGVVALITRALNGDKEARDELREYFTEEQLGELNWLFAAFADLIDEVEALALKLFKATYGYYPCDKTVAEKCQNMELETCPACAEDERCECELVDSETAEPVTPDEEDEDGDEDDDDEDEDEDEEKEEPDGRDDEVTPDGTGGDSGAQPPGSDAGGADPHGGDATAAGTGAGTGGDSGTKPPDSGASSGDPHGGDATAAGGGGTGAATGGDGGRQPPGSDAGGGGVSAAQPSGTKSPAGSLTASGTSIETPSGVTDGAASSATTSPPTVNCAERLRSALDVKDDVKRAKELLKLWDDLNPGDTKESKRERGKIDQDEREKIEKEDKQAATFFGRHLPKMIRDRCGLSATSERVTVASDGGSSSALVPEGSDVSAEAAGTGFFGLGTVVTQLMLANVPIPGHEIPYAKRDCLQEVEDAADTRDGRGAADWAQRAQRLLAIRDRLASGGGAVPNIPENGRDRISRAAKDPNFAMVAMFWAQQLEGLLVQYCMQSRTVSRSGETIKAYTGSYLTISPADCRRLLAALQKLPDARKKVYFLLKNMERVPGLVESFAGTQQLAFMGIANDQTGTPIDKVARLLERALRAYCASPTDPASSEITKYPDGSVSATRPPDPCAPRGDGTWIGAIGSVAQGISLGIIGWGGTIQGLFMDAIPEAIVAGEDIEEGIDALFGLVKPQLETVESMSEFDKQVILHAVAFIAAMKDPKGSLSEIAQGIIDTPKHLLVLLCRIIIHQDEEAIVELGAIIVAWRFMRLGKRSGKSTRKSTGGPKTPARKPSRRHYAKGVNTKTVPKARNTVIDPKVDVASDIKSINAGRAARDRSGNFVINGRTYGMHENGRLIPMHGPGLYKLSRGGFKAFAAFNEFGNTPAAARWLAQNKILPEAIAEGLRAYKEISR